MWVDLRDCLVQSPDIIARLSALETEIKPLVAKMAVLTASQLKAIQARLVSSRDGYKVSLDADELTVGGSLHSRQSDAHQYWRSLARSRARRRRRHCAPLRPESLPLPPLVPVLR